MKARQEEAQRRREAALASHTFVQLRGKPTCSACGAKQSDTGLATSPCPGFAAWLVQLWEQPHGYRLRVADSSRSGDAGPGCLVICRTCGAWTETGASRNLRAPCIGRRLSKHATDALRHVMLEKHPKPSSATLSCCVTHLQPLAEVVAEGEFV